MCLTLLPTAALAAERPANDAWPEQISSYVLNSVAADIQNETSVKAGQAVEIIRRENLTTPYRWLYRVSDENAIRLLHDYYERDPNPEERDGVGGTHYYYFTANAPGKYDIEFQDVRIGEAFKPDRRVLVYALTVTD